MKRTICRIHYIPDYAKIDIEDGIPVYCTVTPMSNSDSMIKTLQERGDLVVLVDSVDLNLPTREELVAWKLDVLNNAVKDTYVEAETKVQQYKEEIARLSAITYQPREETTWTPSDDDIPF